MKTIIPRINKHFRPFCLVIFLFSFGYQSFAGAQMFPVRLKSVLLEEAFKHIERVTGYSFLYAKETVSEVRERVTINLEAGTIDEILKECFLDKPLTYVIKEKKIIVRAIERKEIRDVFQSSFFSDIYGRVLNENNQPLQGASVQIKGQKKGVETGDDGRFVIKGVKVTSATILVSYVGYETVEVLWKSNQQIQVQLKPTGSQLDEIQTIAYGKVSKRFQVGNVFTIKAEDIQKQPVNNPLLALQGQVPGMEITQVNGLPGTGITVRIQGVNSFRGGMDPLYVVDGVPYPSQLLTTSGIGSILGGSGSGNLARGGAGNPLNYLNPADIESIDVLKDADATAVYGSRASNGAVLITTKRGKAGRTTFSGSLQRGTGKITKRVDLLNSQQYVMMRREAMKNDNILPNADNSFDISNLYGWDTSRTMDWQKILLGGTAKYHNAQFSVSGGTDLTQYLVSGTYYRETGVTSGNFADVKASAHFSLNTASRNQKLKMSVSASFMADNNRLQNQDLAGLSILLSPTAPDLYDKNGSLNWALNSAGTSTWSNPIAYLTGVGRYVNKTNSLNSSVELSYRILQGLTAKVRVGYNNIQSDEVSVTPNSYFPPESQQDNLGTTFFNNSWINNFIVEPIVTYNSRLGDGRLDVQMGGTLIRNKTDGRSIYATTFSSDFLREDIYSAANVYPYGSTAATYKYAAVFGTLNYRLLEKYIVNFNLRRDGSARFGPENRFHTFASVGGGWIFTQEKWLKGSNNILSYGKLRASYGTTGSDQLGDYAFLDLYGASGYPVSYQGVGALTAIQLFNPYTQWELTRKTSVGLDLGFIKDRVVLGMTYSVNRSGNSLVPYNLPYTAGFASVFNNLKADIRNTSLEFLLNSENISTKKFKWSTKLNFTVPRNQLVSFPGIEKTSLNGSYLVGKPLNYYQSLLYDWKGVDPATGANLYATSSGGITSNPSSVTDKILFKPRYTDWSGGIGNDFTIHGVNVSFFFQFIKKQGAAYFGSNSAAGSIGSNKPLFVLNRWQKPGDVAMYQRFTTQTPISNVLVGGSDAVNMDISSVRLRNVSISYSVPEKWRKPLRMQMINVFVNAQNLFVLSKYQGFDPETGISQPPLRVIMTGLQFEF